MITRHAQLATVIAAIALSAGLSMPVSAQDRPAQNQTQASRLPAIVVTKVVARPLVDSVVASGTVRPVQEIFVQPLVDGLSIKTLHADVGDRVKAGDVVAELNSDSLLLQKSQLQANKAKAEAGLAQYRAQVIEAQANADDAVRQRDRAVTLSRNGTVSTSQVEQATASADAALARLNAAKQAVNVGEADIKVVAAQIDDIDLKLERTDVKAPVNGVISARDAKVGAIASGSGTDAADINKLLKMHRQMADMMKAMGGKKGGGMMKQMMGGLASKMGLGGMGGGMGMPDLSKMDPKQLEALAKQAEAAGIKPGGLPGLGAGGLPGLGGPKLPGLGGGGFPGLPGLPKKK